MSTELVAVQTAVAEFDRVAAGLADLQARYANVVFDVSTTAGLEEAKTARAIIREPRYAVERLRANAKAPILELGRSLDTRAKEITSKILRIETPIDSQIKADVRRRASVRRRVGVRRRAREARKEAEKQAKRDAEEKSRRDAEALMAPTPVATHKPVMPAQPRDAELCAAIVGHFAVDSMVADYWLRNYGRASKDA